MRDRISRLDHLPGIYDREEFQRIQRAAEKIRSDSDALVVIGIGGSYLGARAALGMLTHTYYNELPAGDRRGRSISPATISVPPDWLTCWNI